MNHPFSSLPRVGAVLVALVILGSVSAAAAATHMVPQEFATIQAAIDASVDGDRIEVSPGRHRGANLRGKEIQLVSSSGPRVTLLEDYAPVLTLDSGEGPGTLIEGFTVYMRSRSSVGNGQGRRETLGLKINSDAVIRRCVITGSTELLPWRQLQDRRRGEDCGRRAEV